MKRLIYILLFIIGLNFTAAAQERVRDNNPVKYIKFYPNPASAVINFDFQRGYENTYSLQVFNFMGKKVYDIKKVSPRITINLDDFFRGIYIFQLRDHTGTIVQSGKFQVAN